MSVFVTGDTHGPEKIGWHSTDGFIPRLNVKNFPEQRELTKDDFLIICGDFGGIWETNRERFAESSQEKYSLDWLEDKPFTTLFIPGNHENYDRLTGCRNEPLLSCWLYRKMPEEEKEKLRRGYPREFWKGGFTRVIRPSVRMLEPGVFDLDGQKCFAYGGAASHDIADGILDPVNFPEEVDYQKTYRKMLDSGCQFRVRGLSWWDQEMPGPGEEQMAEKALEAAGYHVDFVFTHAAPLSCHASLGFSHAGRVNRFLEDIKGKLTYRHWFFGHLHGNSNLPGGKDHLIYEQILRIC